MFDENAFMCDQIIFWWVDLRRGAGNWSLRDKLSEEKIKHMYLNAKQQASGITSRKSAQAIPFDMHIVYTNHKFNANIDRILLV